MAAHSRNTINILGVVFKKKRVQFFESVKKGFNSLSYIKKEGFNSVSHIFQKRFFESYSKKNSVSLGHIEKKVQLLASY